MRGHCSKACPRMEEASQSLNLPAPESGFPIRTTITGNVKSLSHLHYGVCFACMWRPDLSPGVTAEAIIQGVLFCFVLLKTGSLTGLDSPTQLKRP